MNESIKISETLLSILSCSYVRYVISFNSNITWICIISPTAVFLTQLKSQEIYDLYSNQFYSIKSEYEILLPSPTDKLKVLSDKSTWEQALELRGNSKISPILQQLITANGPVSPGLPFSIYLIQVNDEHKNTIARGLELSSDLIKRIVGERLEKIDRTETQGFTIRFTDQQVLWTRNKLNTKEIKVCPELTSVFKSLEWDKLVEIAHHLKLQKEYYMNNCTSLLFTNSANIKVVKLDIDGKITILKSDTFEEGEGFLPMIENYIKAIDLPTAISHVRSIISDSDTEIPSWINAADQLRTDHTDFTRGIMLYSNTIESQKILYWYTAISTLLFISECISLNETQVIEQKTSIIKTPNFSSCFPKEITTTCNMPYIDFSIFPPTLKWNVKRKLIIHSWGIVYGRCAKTQKNFHAGILSSSKHGVNLKKNDGLSQEVQYTVSRTRRFVDFVVQIILSIENNDLNCIGITCSKGRHRSVTVCEVLHRAFYPNAVVTHHTRTR